MSIIKQIKLPSQAVEEAPYDIYDQRIDDSISSSDEGKILKVDANGNIYAAEGGGSGSVTQVNGFDPDDNGHVDFPYVYSDDSTPTDPTPVNADLLNNQPASYYAAKSETQPQHTTQTVTLTIAGWSNNQQTVPVTDVTAINTVIVAPAPASVSAYGDAGIYASAQGNMFLTFMCETVPTEDVTVNVAIFD